MPEREEMAYGCVFCLTGKEQSVAEGIMQVCPEVKTVVAKVEKYKTVHGKKLRVMEIFLPGYLFFLAPKDLNPLSSFPRDGLIRILTEEDHEWRLSGENARFAHWLFQYDGCLSFSQAYKLDDWIHIASGPLKDMEGRITKIDKRGLSGQVKLEFGGKTLMTWLSFELVEKGTLHAVTSSRTASAVQTAGHPDCGTGSGVAGGRVCAGASSGGQPEKA